MDDTTDRRSDEAPKRETQYLPPYGDLTALNTCRLVLDSVGGELLAEIASDYLSLLDTSGAVYEKSGEYALGIFSSGWCRLLDRASHGLCGSRGLEEALAGGKWLCHESCWTDGGLPCIERGEPVDIACHGGIRIHSVPIRAGEDVVGAMNFGYGDPPRDPETLRDLARRYGVSVEELKRHAEAYEPRDPETIDRAKRRLRTSARLIGEMVRRHRAEAAIRISEREARRERDRAQLYLDVANVIFLALARDGTVQLLNQKACEILRCTAEEALGSDWFETFLPDRERESVRETFRRNLSGEAEMQEHHENPVLSRDGMERLIAWHNTVLRDEEGGIAGTLSAGMDVTEQREAERALHEEKVFVDAALDTATDTLFVFDAETGEPFRWNRAMREVSGYSDEEIAGMKAPDAWFGAEELALAAEAIGRTRQSGRATAELSLITKGGSRIPFEYSASSFRLSEEGPRYILFVGRDIRERRSAEEERRSLEAQVLHAQKLESLGVLAGGIAHDFNNLLTGVLGNTRLALMRVPRESPVVSSLEQIETASERAGELCRQMLAYSGKGRFVIEALDLSRLVEEMVHMLEVSITKRAVLELELAGRIPAIEADATQVRQIVMNLITNASEAIGARGGTITVSTGSQSCDRNFFRSTYFDEELGEGEYVYLEVSDTGVGMDAKTKERIFDPFFTTKFSGRGLGLAAVLGIVRGHRGAIQVVSEPGTGTTCKVLFPASGKAVAEPVRELAADFDRRGEGTVLVADDDVTVRTFAKEVLESAGFRVLVARDGREAVDVYHRHAGRIRLVLLDLTMPHLDGDQVFEELRRAHPEVRVVLTSGYNEQDATERFTGKGLAAFLQKPFGPTQLLGRVFDTLDRAGPR